MHSNDLTPYLPVGVSGGHVEAVALLAATICCRDTVSPNFDHYAHVYTIDHIVIENTPQLIIALATGVLSKYWVEKYQSCMCSLQFFFSFEGKFAVLYYT